MQELAPGDRGFSLVEVLVAAAVITLSLVAVVAFVRKGQEMIALERHRAMARGIIEQQLESKSFQPDNYENIASPFTPANTSVIIDPGTTPNMQGTLTVSVGLEQNYSVVNPNVPYRIVAAAVTWTEPGGENQTVTITKWLANVQRN